MTLFYNKKALKDRRRELRQNSTPAEKVLWKTLRNSKLGVKFRRQYSVGGFVIDFYCPKLKIAIELYGSVHRTQSSKDYDDYREKYLSAGGIKMIKVWNNQIINNPNVIISCISPLLTKERGRGEVLEKTM